MTRNLQIKAEQLAMTLVLAAASRGACLLPAHLRSWGENGNALDGEMACVESPPFWGSDDAPPGYDGMLLARVPEVAFVMMVGQNCPTHYHPVGVGFGTFDCLGEYGLEAIARPWAWGGAPIDRRCLHLSVPSILRSWALGLTKSSDKMPNRPLGDVP